MDNIVTAYEYRLYENLPTEAYSKPLSGMVY